MKNSNLEDVFSRGCLVRLTQSLWTGKIKMPSSLIVDDDGADPEFISAHKRLVEKDSLKPMEKVRNEAKGYMYSKTLPFPIPGILFIPRDLLGEIDARLKEYQEQFYDAVDEFADSYDIFTARAKNKLKDLYNPLEYPHDIRSKFNFSWSFYTLSAPGKAGILSPELYEREQSKFEEEMRQFRETAILTLRQTFVEMVEHLTERLNSGGTFKNTTVDKLKEFLDDFGKLNVTEDHALKALVENAKTVLTGDIEAQELRDDSEMRKRIASQMQKVQETMKGSILDQRGVLLEAA